MSEQSLSLYEIETGLAEALAAAEDGDETALAIVAEWMKAAPVKRDRVAAFIAFLASQEDLGAKERDRLSKRIDTIRKHRERLEASVVSVMQVIEVRKLEGDTATFRLRKKPDTAVITDPDKIPAEYMSTPEPPEPRPVKRLILADLKAGKAVPGADIQFGDDGLKVT